MFKKLKSLAQEGFFHILIGNTLTKMIAFFSSIILVRFVDKGSYTYLTSADNMYSYIVQLYGLGLPSALLLSCSSSNEQNKNKSYFNFALKYGIIIQLILSGVVVIYASFVQLPFPEIKHYVYLLIFYPLLNQLNDTYQVYFRANLLNKEYAFSSFLQTLVLFLGNVVFLRLLGTTGNVLARYIALLVTFLYLFLQARHLSQNQKEVVPLSKEDIKLFVEQAFAFLIANYFSGIMPQNEMSLVNRLIGDEVLTANYKVAVAIPSQIIFVTSSLMIFYFPKFAQMKNPNEIKEKSIKLAIGTFVLVGVISLVGFFLSPYIINIVYGDKYNDAIELSAAFWIANGLNAGFRMVPGNIIPAIGEFRYNAIISVVTCGVHFVLEYLLIKQYGISGVAVGSALLYLISGIVFWIYLLRTLKRREKAYHENEKENVIIEKSN